MNFERVSLKGLDEVKLLNRMDSKFIFHIDDFPSILDELKPYYRVLEIDNKRMFPTSRFTLIPLICCCINFTTTAN